MEIKHAYVKSRTLEDDYHWAPRNGRDIGYRLDEICTNVHSPEWGAVIIEENGLIYFMSEGIKTTRKDQVNRPVLNQALFEVDGLETAYSLYDLTQQLTSWSERYFESNGKTGHGELDEILRSNPRKIMGICMPHIDRDSGAKVFILPKSKSVNHSQNPIPPKKSRFFSRFFG